MGRTDATRWEQEHGGGHQQACTRRTRRGRPARAVWPVPGASVSRSRFEWLEGNAQGFDFRFERLPRQAQLGRRAGWAGHPAAALGQRGFDQGAFVLGTCRHQGHGRPGPRGRFPLQPALLDGKGVARTQDDGALNDVLQFADVPGPVVGLKQVQGLLVDGPDLFPGLFGVALDQIRDEDRNVVHALA